MANIFMNKNAKKDWRKGQRHASDSQTSSSHRSGKLGRDVFDRLFSSKSSRSKEKSQSGSNVSDNPENAGMMYGIDGWYERAGEGGVLYNAIGQNLPSRHPYGGGNYARFETPLRLIEDEMKATPPNQPENTPSSPFRFLDLPKEIRLMVYECLTIRTRHDNLTKEYAYAVKKFLYPGKISCTMVTKCLPGISILATCREISEEAWPVLMPLLNFVNYQPLRILLDIRNAAETIASPASTLAAIIGYYAALRTQPTLSYTEFLDEARQSFNPKPHKSEVDLLNNGYYQDYPFHLYPWIFRDDPVFCNSIDKAARQLVAYSPRGSCLFGTTSELHIGLTNIDGLTSDMHIGCTDLLHSALQRWFNSTRVVIIVRPVPHTDSAAQFTNAMSNIWQPVWRSNFTYKVVRGQPVSIEEWEDSWAEGEKFLD